MSLTIKVIRNKKSYDFRANHSKSDSFENNWKNNGLDIFMLSENGVEVFSAPCQTVANYCFGDMKTADTVLHGDTVAAGNFAIRCFVPSRNFHGEIHGIINARDVDGQLIDAQSMQTTEGGFQNGRWLVHDKFSFNTGRDTNYAWSAGCFILASTDLARFNAALKSFGIKSGDIIPCELTEV